MRTNTDSPCPTSNTTSSTSPLRGSSCCGHNSGNHSSSANALPGTPRGNNSHSAPSNANGNATPCASGNHHSAKRLCASHANGVQLRSKHHADARHSPAPAPGQHASSPVPSNANGTTTRLHQGIASKFANGPASDAWSNNTTVNGNNPSVATVCADRKPRNQCMRPGRHQASQTTPAKLSQNPAINTAIGSHANTTNAASANEVATPPGRRPKRAITTTAIISTVRTVGSAKPATAA